MAEWWWGISLLLTLATIAGLISKQLTVNDSTNNLVDFAIPGLSAGKSCSEDGSEVLAQRLDSPRGSCWASVGRGPK